MTFALLLVGEVEVEVVLAETDLETEQSNSRPSSRTRGRAVDLETENRPPRFEFAVQPLDSGRPEVRGIDPRCAPGVQGRPPEPPAFKGSAGEALAALDLIELPGGAEKQQLLRRVGAMLQRMKGR